MTQDDALRILKTGANVFLTGEPGAGKTYTVNQYVAYLKSCDIDVAITASTGIAATHIGGVTIHSWSGIGIKESLTKYDLDKIASSEYVNKRVRKTKILIIDEISMLRAGTLSMVDGVCRAIKQNSEPFGGMQVVLVGDFFQLPPIQKFNTKESQGTLMEESEPLFAYESSSWKNLNPVTCYLTDQYRQDDNDFLDLLGAIRSNTVDDAHYENMKSRYVSKDEFPENVTKLFSKNLDVDRVNDQMLVKIEGDDKVYQMESVGPTALVTTLKKGCMSPEVLVLKKGAVVMCTKNNPKERFVNGTLGTVIEFESFSGNPIIETHDGRNIQITPMDWSIEENGKIKAKITQVPLRLAWAITVHKSQGMSMDAAIMDLSNVFEYGQGYVALSRVRRMSGLYLLGVNDRALQVHPNILEEDSVFKKSSTEAEEVFGNLSEEEVLKMHQNFVIALGGKWKTKKEKDKDKENKEAGGKGVLEKIRTKHKNAYKRWTGEEEIKVKGLYEDGKSVKEIAELSDRQVGGIKARLIKMGLIEE